MTTHHRGLRPALLATSALLISGLLAACGSSDNGNESTELAPVSLPPAEGTTQYPLTIDTQWGETTIDERPERIVAGTTGDVDLMAALDVTPIGADELIELTAYTTKQLRGEVAATWDTGEVLYPLEPIAATDPDLMVISSVVDKPDNYDELSNLAPVVGPEPTEEGTPTWQERIRQLGLVLDLQERAEQVIADNGAYFERVRAEHPEFADMTIALLHFWGGDYGAAYLSTPGSGSERLFTELGFPPNPDAARFAGTDELSVELVGSIEADIVVITDASDAPDEFRAFVDQPLFQNLDAVKSGRLVELVTHGYGDITIGDKVIAEDFGHFGWAINGDNGPVPLQALASFFVPALATVASTR